MAASKNQGANDQAPAAVPPASRPQSAPPPVPVMRPSGVDIPSASEGGAPNETGRAARTFALENTPPWLVSMALHVIALAIMGSIVYVRVSRQPIQLKSDAVWAEKIGEQLESDSSMGLPDVKVTTDRTILTPDNLPPVENPLASPSPLEVRPEGTRTTNDISAPTIGLALSGREIGSATRQGLLGRYGGTETTERAVQRGLEWLARNQRGDGSWSLSGPFSGGVHQSLNNETSATAMALLAFQGAGHTHLCDSKFKRNVARGWKWLLQQQDDSGCFFQYGINAHRFYTQGQCAIAVCELYGMTKDAAYKAPAQRAIDYCLRTQSRLGGWRYSPNEDSDVSVTGWIVMALQSARMAGLNVPEENLREVSKYLDDVAQANGARYPYQKDGEPLLSMTAEALLMRQYLGWPREDRRLVAGVEWITSPENLVSFKENRNVYYWYYATQVAHHMGGYYWERWNNVMRRALPKQQVAVGRDAGSWDPDRPMADQWAAHGGRLYVTCLSIYMLEVYYRHLPIYSSVYAKPPAKPASPRKT